MIERLVIAKRFADEIVDLCLAGRPNEACGIVALDGGTAVRVFAMSNAAASPVRYSLDPKEQLAVYDVLDSNGWSFAVFHSHTRSDAYPSATDVREAREDVPYIIVSLASDPADIRAYRIKKDDWLAESGEIEEVSLTLLR